MPQDEENSETPLHDGSKNQYYRSIFTRVIEITWVCVHFTSERTTTRSLFSRGRESYGYITLFVYVLEEKTANVLLKLSKEYDTDHDGFINVHELHDMIESREYENDIPVHVVRKVHEMADQNGDDRIDPDLQNSLGHCINRYIQIMVPRGSATTEIDGLYQKQYTCYPPVVGMLIISIMEVIFFCVDEAIQAGSTKTATGPISSTFIYDPYKRNEAWRFLTYMFVHVGLFHLFSNLVHQILLGIPLEIVYKWWRVLIIYFSGVLAGSLAISIADPTTKLAGASGGVYALITAQLATIIMHWKQMVFPLVPFFLFLLDSISNIYNQYVMRENKGYVAHWAGAGAGFLVGLNVLNNLDGTKVERMVWWCSMVTYVSLMAAAIIWNLVWPGYFPQHEKA